MGDTEQDAAITEFDLDAVEFDTKNRIPRPRRAQAAMHVAARQPDRTTATGELDDLAIGRRRSQIVGSWQLDPPRLTTTDRHGPTTDASATTPRRAPSTACRAADRVDGSGAT
ncbi:MAG: hypothetical protein CL424_02955 [Acidimicrobiaceae bacterium]|nr:hypothetical protein [Acidimicrobiaceae bacterium]